MSVSVTGTGPSITVDGSGSTIAVTVTTGGGSGGGVSDHGLLTGLSDDDHDEVYVRYTIGASPPGSPRVGDLWMETS